MDVLSSWLEQLGLDRYASVFAENEVDLEALRLLSKRHLQDLDCRWGRVGNC